MSCCCDSKIKLRIVSSNPCRYGSHVNLHSTILETLKGDCKCAQIFLGNKLSYNSRTLSANDKEATIEYCEKHDKTFYVHASLILNLAKDSDIETKNSFDAISKELTQIKDMPAACVLHIGKRGTIENVCRRINDLESSRFLYAGSHERTPYPLLMENDAGSGTAIGTSLDELRHLFEGIDCPHVGLCIDTQHSFAGGLCDFQNHEDVVKFFDECESISPGGISLVHLNDSEKEFGSRVDRHAPLGMGYIWGKGQFSGLKTLIERCREKNIDMVSETSDPESDHALIRRLSPQ